MLQQTTITVKGQITIPIELRRKFNLKPGSQAVVVEEMGEVKIKSVRSFNDYYGAFKSSIKYDKEAARKLYMPKVLAGEI